MDNHVSNDSDSDYNFDDCFSLKVKNSRHSPPPSTDDLTLQIGQEMSIMDASPMIELTATDDQLTTTETPILTENDLVQLSTKATFEDLGVHPTLINHLAKRMQISTPTAIQRAVFSTVLTNKKLQHRDIAIQSETGSGKTLSFLIPIIQSLLFANPEPSVQLSRDMGPLCLILSPTRELAQQTHKVLDTLINLSRYEGHKFPPHWLVTSTIVGGENKKSEKARIRKGLNVIVSTPGRILDHLRTTMCLDLRSVRYVVLDEADRLLDLGFERDLKSIFAYLNGEADADTKQMHNRHVNNSIDFEYPPTTAWPAKRQVFLCSATMHKVTTLAKWILNKPVHVSADGNSSMLDSLSNSSAPSLLKHQYMVVPLKYKLVGLLTYLCGMTRGGEQSSKKAIVFFSTRGSVDYYHAVLNHFLNQDRTDQRLGFMFGLDVLKLHGSMDPNDRKSTLAKFSSSSNGTGQVLITTDVSARGLDLAGVDLIIQYDAPTDVADFVHRAGRTARAGRKGLAALILSIQEEAFATQVLCQSVPELELVDVKSRVSSMLHVPIDQWEKAAARQWLMPFENHVHRDRELRKLAMLGFQSYVKGYATYPSALKPIFHVRKLHLGHLANSFCLKEAPAELPQILGQMHAKDQQAKSPHKRAFGVDSQGVVSYTKTVNAQDLLASEFQVSIGVPRKKMKR